MDGADGPGISVLIKITKGQSDISLFLSRSIDAPSESTMNVAGDTPTDATEEASMDADFDTGMEGSIEKIIQRLDDPKEVEESNETPAIEEEEEVPEESGEPENTSENKDEAVEKMDES